MIDEGSVVRFAICAFATVTGSASVAVFSDDVLRRFADDQAAHVVPSFVTSTVVAYFGSTFSPGKKIERRMSRRGMLSATLVRSGA